MKKWALVGLAVASAALISFACSSSDDKAACADGDRQQCTCSSGGAGTATCAGGAFGQCVCAASSSSSGGEAGAGEHEGGLPSIDAGFGNYLGACGKNEDCPDGGQCFNFNTKGMICTHACTTSEQCEAPSPKCNPRGVCAVPD